MAKHEMVMCDCIVSSMSFACSYALCCCTIDSLSCIEPELVKVGGNLVVEKAD